MSPHRILLLARDMVGDLVNTTGAATWLRQSFPQANFVVEGGFACEEFFPEFEVWVRKRRGGLLGKLNRVARYRRGRFDLAIVLDDSREATRLARLAGIQTVAPIKGQQEHDLFDALHQVLTDVARRFGLPEPCRDALAPNLPLPPVEEQAGVVLHVTASDIAKEWPEDQWIELAKRIECIIAGGPGDEAVVARIAQASGRRALPALPLLEYAAVLQRTLMVVTGDTGPAHIAAAVGTRAIVLYGPTEPARFHPWGTNWVALRHPLGCNHYGSGCAFKEAGVCSQKCMRAVSVDEVLSALTPTQPGSET